MDAKLDILSKLLGENILIGVQVRLPRLGASYSLLYNDSLNLVVPQKNKRKCCREFSKLWYRV
jgi:hypothetical protein